MSKSTINPTVKKRGRPNVDSEQINFRVQRADLNALDQMAKKCEISRTEAIRTILRLWLIENHYLDIPDNS